MLADFQQECSGCQNISNSGLYFDKEIYSCSIYIIMILIMWKIEIIFSCLLLLKGSCANTEDFTFTLELTTSEHAVTKVVESSVVDYTVEAISNFTTNFNNEVFFENNLPGSCINSTIKEGVTEVPIDGIASERDSPQGAPQPPQARGPPRFRGTAKEQQTLDYIYNFFNYYYNPIVVIVGLFGEYGYLF